MGFTARALTVHKTLERADRLRGHGRRRRRRLLLVRRRHQPSAGLWSIPGGRVEPGETPAEAVVELAEETGLEGVRRAFVGWVERIDDESHFVILDFSVEVLDAERATAGDDAVELAWVPLEEVGEWDPSTGWPSSSTSTGSSRSSSDPTGLAPPGR